MNDEKTVTLTKEEIRYLLRLTENVRTNFLDLDMQPPCVLRRVNNKLIEAQNK